MFMSAGGGARLGVHPYCENERRPLTARRARDMSEDAIKSASRTLRIFEYFDRIERPAGVLEVAEILHIPRSSAAALISDLVQLGYLSHDRASRQYMPTMKLAQLGRWVEAALVGRDRDTLGPLLHEVARAVDETVVLGVQDDLFVQYVHVELAQRPVMYFQRAGARRPTCRSAVGWALLTYLSDEEVQQTVERHNAHADDKTVRAADVLRHVRKARAQGYALSLGGFLPGVAMVAMPVTSRDGLRRYALGVGGPIERVKTKEAEVGKALAACRDKFLKRAA